MTARSHGFVFPAGFPPCNQCGRDANDLTHVNPAKQGRNPMMGATDGVRVIAADRRHEPVQPRRSHVYATGYASFHAIPCVACGQPMGASCHSPGMPAGANCPATAPAAPGGGGGSQMASENEPESAGLWASCIAAAKKKFTVYPSAYANGWAVQEYKRRGGKWRQKASKEDGLGKWFAEDWVDISRTNSDGSHPACGRPTDGMSQADYSSKYPKCVPASKAKSMSSEEKKSAVERKRDANNAGGDGKGQSPKMVSTKAAEGPPGSGPKEGYGTIVLIRHKFQALPNQATQDPDYKLCALCGFGQDDEVHQMKEPGERGPNGETNGDSQPDFVTVKQLAKEGDPSATSKDKDPSGGLSAAGRKKFGVKKGVVSYSSASPEDKSRWVRWALRFTKTPRPLKDDKGEPTRYALMFHAWGEPVPTSDAAVRAVHAKAMTRRGQLGMGDRETASAQTFHHDFDRDVRRNTCAICDQRQDHSEHDMEPESARELSSQTATPVGTPAFVTALNGKTILTGPANVFGQPDQSMPRELAAAWETASAQNPHFQWIEGRFVEADRPNRNKAAWSSQDLEMGEPTVAHGPLNWLHDERHIIGTIAAAKLVIVADRQAAGIADDIPNTHIRALAPVWSYIYPAEARQIARASDERKLWYSMECVSREVACLQPGCTHSQSYGDYMLAPHTRCDHVKQGGNRRFTDPSFLGGAVIIPPVRPGWGGANATVMRQAAMMAERQEASLTGLTEEEAVSMVAQIITYSEGAA